MLFGRLPLSSLSRVAFLALAGWSAACSSNSDVSAPGGPQGTGGIPGTGGNGPTGGGAGASGMVAGVGGSAGSTAGSGGTRGTGGNGTAGSAAGGAGTGGAVITGDAGGASCPAGASATLTNVMNGSVAVGAKISLTGVVATSPKFLASKGSKGACTWAVFVSEPVAQAVPYSGGIVMTLGARAPLDATGAYGDCPKGTDPIPDDTAPGDALNLSGSVTSYVKSTCATTTTPPPVAEVRITDACGIQRTARGKALPTPAAVATPSELTNSANDAAHRKWTGVLVRLTNVAAVDVPGGTGPVSSVGTISLANGVHTRDRVYQPRAAVFAPNTTFASVTGLSHLDVCTWSLEPRDPCTDFNPKSQGCP